MEKRGYSEEFCTFIMELILCYLKTQLISQNSSENARNSLLLSCMKTLHFKGVWRQRKPSLFRKCSLVSPVHCPIEEDYDLRKTSQQTTKTVLDYHLYQNVLRGNQENQRSYATSTHVKEIDLSTLVGVLLAFLTCQPWTRDMKVTSGALLTCYIHEEMLDR